MRRSIASRTSRAEARRWSQQARRARSWRSSQVAPDACTCVLKEKSDRWRAKGASSVCILIGSRLDDRPGLRVAGHFEVGKLTGDASAVDPRRSHRRCLSARREATL